MNSSIQIFNNNEFSVRTTRDDDGTIWFVAKDIALALEYSEATVNNNISNLFKSVPDIWAGNKPFIVRSENGVTQEREMLCLTEQGVYFFLGRSDKPKALPYQMWIARDVVPSIRETGSYSIKQSDEKDIEVRLKELEEHKRDQDLLGAQILQSMIDKQLFPVTPETRTVFAHEVFKLVTGHSYLGMLPECTEKWFTAGEIGEAVGLSANMVGRIAKKNGIQAPEGESNEFGRWIFTKSRYSNREVTSFIYSEAGLDWFRHYQQEVSA